MPCTCRVDYTSHPYGNTVAAEEVVTQCEECYMQQLDDEADELQAEAENARMAELEAMELARLGVVA